jgi:hypothetical protein
MSLTHCLKKLRTAVIQRDADAVTALADTYRTEGMVAQKANIAAVRDYMQDLLQERGEIGKLIEAEGGKLPRRVERETGDVDRAAGEIAKSLGVNLSSAGENALQGLVELFGGGDPNRLNTGPTFDEETYQKAKPYFDAMFADFKAAGKDLRDFMAKMIEVLRGLGVADPKPVIMRYAQDLKAESANADAGTKTPDPQDRPDADANIRGNLQAEGRPESGADAGRPGSQDGGRAQRPAADGVPDRSTTTGGERGNQQGSATGQQSAPDRTRSADVRGSRGDSAGGLFADRTPAASPAASPAKPPAVIQPPAGAIKPANRDQIAAQMPFLKSGQIDDVVFAESRFSKPEGFGVLFTNGTGTGKTFTGLGIARRFMDRGKTNILMISPKQTILKAWQEAGSGFFDMPIKILSDTNDNGQGGPVATTFANFYQNNSLAQREWDLILLDESHYLGSNSKGEATQALTMFRALGGKDARSWVNARYSDKVAKMSLLYGEAKNLMSTLSDSEDDRVRRANAERSSELLREADAINKELEALLKERQAVLDAMPAEDKPRAVFLSATPFAYDMSVIYGQGFLFDWGIDDPGKSRGYNGPDKFQGFMIEHFGYRMRYGKLTKPDGKVDSGLMERNFNAWLKKEGALSGRGLESDFDYDRRFVLSDSKLGRRIDEALGWLFDRKKYENDKTKQEALGSLEGLIKANFGYHDRMYLLEAIKADLAIPYIKAQLKAGRKVLVMHDFKKGGFSNPFFYPQLMENGDIEGMEGLGELIEALSGGRPASKEAAVEEGRKQALRAVYADFVAEFPDLQELQSLPSPIQRLGKEFPEILIYNGNVSSKRRLQMQNEFNSDAKDSPRLMLAQGDAMREGVSIHDTSGKFQRVLVHLGMPVAPTSAIQQEGRINRIGQASDAIFRYLTIDTNWERTAFASKIAGRVDTVDNLAMGEEARGLKQAFIDAYEDAGEFLPGHDGEGKGGKARDIASRNILTQWDQAKSFYYGTMKKGGRRDQREGLDYYATPEPVGLKMVEFADIRPGDDVLEPSAGHGAIARWFPEVSNITAIEPSQELFSKIGLRVQGRLENDTFENLHIGNKYDAIVMNPPFGVGGKTAMDHIAKAYDHLREGGRVVALIPTGPSADARFEKWFFAQDERGRQLRPEAQLVKAVNLPRVTFERAGTSVASRIVVIEKAAPGAQIIQSMRDLTTIETIDELFDTMESMQAPERLKPKDPATVPGNPGVAPAANRPERPTISSAEGLTPDSFESVDGKHTQTKETLFLVKAKGRMERSDYELVANRSRQHGGFWDRYSKAFRFRTEANRQAFLDSWSTAGVQAEDAAYSVNERKTSSIQGRKRGFTVPAEAQRDLFASGALPDADLAAQVADEYFVRHESVAVGQFRTGITKVVGAREVAHVLAPIRKHSQETMLALVLDADYRPIEIIQHTIGTKDSSLVANPELLGAVASVDGAKHVWFAHNHPAGSPQPSAADRNVQRQLHGIMQSSGIEVMGHVVITSRAEFNVLDDAGNNLDSYGYNGTGTRIPPAARTSTVPVTQRRLRGKYIAAGKGAINSSELLKQYASQMKSENALILMNGQMEPVAIITMSAEEMQALRGGDRVKRLLQAFHKSNARFIAIKSSSRAAATNIASFIKRFPQTLSITDWVYPDSSGNLVSLRSTSSGAASGWVEDSLGKPHFFKVSQNRSGAGMSADKVQAAIAGTTKQWKSAPNISVVQTMDDLPGHIRDEAIKAEHGVDGAYDSETGTIYLVADHIISESHARRVLAHEAVGHYAFDREFGDVLERIYEDLDSAIAKDAELQEIAAQVAREYGDQPIRVQNAEIIARMAERNIKPSLWMRLRAAVRDLLRRIGFDINFDKADLDAMLVAANDALRQKHARDGARREPTMSRQNSWYYSGLLRAASSMKQERGTKQQMLQSLKAQPGVKAEEIFWTGVEEWLNSLDARTVTKAELIEYIENNGVAVEVRELTGYGTDNFYIEESRDDEGTWLIYTGDDDVVSSHNSREEAEAELSDTSGARYNRPDIVLPGGENYREVLLTLPSSDGISDPANWDEASELMQKYDIPGDENPMESDEQAFSRIGRLIREKNRPSVYTSSHWDQPNVLAHIRLNDRMIEDPATAKLRQEINRQLDATAKELSRVVRDRDIKRDIVLEEMRQDLRQRVRSGEITIGDMNRELDAIVMPDDTQLKELSRRHGELSESLRKLPGRKRTLFIEEIQSDWHQTGRKKGYRKTDTATLQDLTREQMIELLQHNDRNGAYTDQAREDEGEPPMTLQEARAAIQAIQDEEGDGFDVTRFLRGRTNQGGVPDAPFKENAWVELSLKRVLRMAAEGGYDAVAWTIGEQQVVRYDLSKRVREVSVFNKGDGTWEVTALALDGTIMDVGSAITTDKLADYIGKDLAERAAAEVGERKGADYAGNDLKTGGQGMRSFYDRTVPNVVKDLTRKLGAKVSIGSARIDTGMPAGAKLGLFPDQKKELKDLMRRVDSYDDAEFNEEFSAITGLKLDEEQIDDIRSGMADPERRASFMREILPSIEKEMQAQARTDNKVHIFDLPEKVKESALRGMPLFSRVTESAAFRRWFGDRNDPRVTDKSGQAKVFYHATFNDFDVFDREWTLNVRRRSMDTVGIWFSDNPGKGGAEDYGNIIMPVFLRAKKLKAYGNFDDFLREMHEAEGRDFSKQNPKGLGSAEGLRAKLKAEGYDGITFPKNNWSALKAEEKELDAAIARANDEYKQEARRLREMGLEMTRRDGMPFQAKIDRLVQERQGVWDKLKPIAQDQEWSEQTAVVVFEPTQIKSAIGNNGNFDPQNPSILFSRAAAPAAGIAAANPAPTPSNKAAAVQQHAGYFEVPEETKLRAVQRKMQDKLIRVKELQKALRKTYGQGAITDKEDIYLAEAVSYGRIEERLRKFQKNFMDPLVEAMKDSTVSMEELDLFLYAMHAKDRNRHIAGMYPNDPSMHDGGSGMTNAQALAILQRFKAEGKLKEAGRLADFVYSMNRDRLRVLMQAGLETPETVKTWITEFGPFYVPLKGSMKDKGKGSLRVGRGFDIRGKESLRAFGRRTLAESPIIHTMVQFEVALVRAEKNEVSNKLLSLAKKFPNKQFWRVHSTNINTMPKRKRWNPDTMEVEMIPDFSMYNDPQYVGVKRDGKQYFVWLQDPLLARAIENVGPERLNALMQTMNWVNRGLAAINTSFNPEFVLTNPARDIQTAIFNIISEQDLPDGAIRGKHLAAKIVKDIPSAMRGAYRGLRDKDNPQQLEWQRWFDEYRESGAKVGFFGLRDFDAMQRDMARAMRKAQRMPNPMDAFFAIERWVNDANGAVENAVRLAAYKNARDVGLSKAKAAELAKNLTVNFNRKGELGTFMNTMYLFYNASTQGSMQFLRAIKSRKAQMLATAIAAGAYALAEMNRMMGGDDEDGAPWYDDVPDYVKERNMVFMKWDGSGEYYTFPLPYGYNVFHVAGTVLNDFANGSRSMESAAKMMAMTALGSFNPLGLEESEEPVNAVIKTLAPIPLFDPLLQLALNETFYGGPVYYTNFPGSVPRPDSELGMRNTPEFWKDIARAANEATGGSKSRPGSIDVHPETLQHIVQFAGGGSLAFVERSIDFVAKLVSGEEIEPRQVPFVRRFHGKVQDTEDRGTYERRLTSILQYDRELKDLSEVSRVQAAQFKRQYPQAFAMTQLAKDTEKKITRLTRERRELEIKGGSELEIRRQTEEINRLVDAFNREYNRQVGQDVEL